MELTIKLKDLSEKEKQEIGEFLSRYTEKAKRIYEEADMKAGDRCIKYMGGERIFTNDKGIKYILKLQAQDKLFRLAQEREKAHPIDWSDLSQSKYYFCSEYNHYGKPDKHITTYHTRDCYENSSRVYFVGFSDLVDFKNYIEQNLTSEELDALCEPVRFK